MNILMTGKDQDKGVPKGQEVKKAVLMIPSHSLFRKSVFDTKNYYFYFTEVWKEKA